MEMPQQTEDWYRALQGTPSKMGVLEGHNQDLNCDCGSELHTMQYLLQCPLLEQVCTAKDLAAHNDTGSAMFGATFNLVIICVGLP